MAESLEKQKLITFSDVKLRIKETLDKAVNQMRLTRQSQEI